jgi:acetyl esterase/lipase
MHIARLKLNLVVSLAVVLVVAFDAVAQEKPSAVQDKPAAAPEKKAPLPVTDQLRQRYSNKLDIRFDVPYAGNSNRFQQLDLYLPKMRASDKPLPVMVYIHGGGWSGGDRKGFGSLAAARAESGKYVGVSVGYRLSGEAKWPAQIHDCKAAIRWLRGNAKELNIDPDKIGVGGSSAGGHLSALLGLTGGNKELEGDVGEFTSLGSQVACVVDFCGPTDMTSPLMQGEAAKKDDPAVAGLIGGSLKDKHDAAVASSPMTYVSKNAAPFLIVHGSNDTRVNYEQSVNLDAALKKAGASSILVQMTGAGHGIPTPPALMERINQFLDLHLRGVPAEISSEPIGPPQPPAASPKT